MKEWLKESRAARGAVLALLAVSTGCGAIYLYYHDPYKYPLPCLFYIITGFYCPGCGAGRACYSILHGRIADAFCYNPLMTILLPLIGLYIAARAIDWWLTGGNHIDIKISAKMLVWVLVITLIYGVVRNIPVFPFELLAPGGIVKNL